MESNGFNQMTLLTPREAECLFHWLHGKTMKVIAEVLFISPKTVERHLEHIKDKLYCKNKMELIQKCVELGILNVELPATFSLVISKRCG